MRIRAKRLYAEDVEIDDGDARPCRGLPPPIPTRERAPVGASFERAGAVGYEVGRFVGVVLVAVFAFVFAVVRKLGAGAIKGTVHALAWQGEACVMLKEAYEQKERRDGGRVHVDSDLVRARIGSGDRVLPSGRKSGLARVAVVDSAEED